MTTRRTTKSTAKKSLGNLLREEVQKDSDHTREPEAPEAAVPEKAPTKTRSSRNTAQRSQPEPQVASPSSESDSPEVNTEMLANLERLQAQLEQAQQQNAALSTEKANLEQRLETLSKNLGQEAELKVQAQAQVAHLQAELNTAQSQAQPAPSTALTVLPRSAHFQSLALPRAFSRPIVNRPMPWDIPRRPLVITGAIPPAPSDLSDEDIGWFD